jgi:hypothetical protein
LDNNNVAIVKKRKKLNKERKGRFGGGLFWESKCVPVTPILFDFLANGSAALLALGQPAARIFTTDPDFYSSKNQNLFYFCDFDWPRATAPVVFALKSKDTQALAAFKKS